MKKRVSAAEEIATAEDSAAVDALKTAKRKLGLYGDLIKIADDFDAPFSPETFLPEEPQRKKSRKKR